MEKSKLGISVCLLGMIVFLTGYLGITALILVAGYILLKEENETLRKYAVYSVVIYIAFVLVTLCLGALNTVIDIINFRSWMYDSTIYSVIRSILSTVGSIISLAEKAVFGLLALCALLGKTVKFGALDKLIEKHM